MRAMEKWYSKKIAHFELWSASRSQLQQDAGSRRKAKMPRPLQEVTANVSYLPFALPLFCNGDWNSRGAKSFKSRRQVCHS
jgi:hypothetical protein